jgi:hypothetical protein
MKDLDYDELDRAVNSLITNNSDQVDNKVNTETPNNSSNPPVYTLPSVDTPLVTKNVVDPSPVAIPIPLPTPIEPPTIQQATSEQPKVNATTPLVTRQNTGRFMDVVHPSSNMRPTLTMPNRDLSQNTMIKASPIIAPTPTPIKRAPIISLSGLRSNLIDFHKPQNNPIDKQPEPYDDSKDADIDKINDEITDTLKQPSDSTPDSPFISGTKVDKRPLGAFSSEAPTPLSFPIPIPTPTPTPTPPAMPQAPITVITAKEPISDSKANGNNISYGSQLNNNIDTPMPAELQNELLSIEADSTTHPELLDSFNSTPAPVSEPISKINVDTSSINSQPLTGPTSITQQYKEQPNSGDSQTSAIYDNAAYNKSLSHPAKKKSGWSWVVWAIILLVVGAAVGAAVYFLVLPNISL